MNVDARHNSSRAPHGGSRYGPIFSLLQSLLCQTGGYCLAIVLRSLQVGPGWPLLAHALLAAALAKLLRLPLPWLLLNTALPFVPLIPAEYTLPQWLLTLAIAVLLLTYIPTFWTRVPFYPSSLQTVRALSERLSELDEFRFLDLGSGFGSPVIELASENQRGSFFGIELSPLPYAISTLRSLQNRRATFIFNSFWQHPLASYDVVYAFLSPTPMKDLWEKVSKEMKPGSIFITNSFAVPAEADEVINLDSDRQHSLYVFKF